MFLCHEYFLRWSTRLLLVSGCFYWRVLRGFGLLNGYSCIRYAIIIIKNSVTVCWAKLVVWYDWDFRFSWLFTLYCFGNDCDYGFVGWQVALFPVLVLLSEKLVDEFTSTSIFFGLSAILFCLGVEWHEELVNSFD